MTDERHPPLLRTYIDGTPEAAAALDRLRARGESDFTRVEADVRAILAGVRDGGDAAVLAFAERFDARRPAPLVRRACAPAACSRGPTRRRPSRSPTATAASSARGSPPLRGRGSTRPGARRA